jgi:hypothetical protein
MLTFVSYHIEFANGASHLTQNLSYGAWALWSPSYNILHFSGIFLGPVTNNEVEYDVVIKLLVDNITFHTHDYSVHVDS